jgi:hypothetical protein
VGDGFEIELEKAKLVSALPSMRWVDCGPLGPAAETDRSPAHLGAWYHWPAPCRLKDQ